MAETSGIDIIGLLTILLLYIVILAFGIIASYKFRRKYQADTITEEEMNLVAGRKITSLVGVFTMTATTVGGGYINGTAESVATQGIIWTLSPFGIFFGLIIGGLFYAKKMREKNFLTMLDPFQQKYNDSVIGLLYLAALCGDIFWSASLLAALGTSLSVIIGIDVIISILVSAAIAVAYTAFGQMVSVAYTDIVQLLLIIIGLVVAVPFALHHEASENLMIMKNQWTGSLDKGHVGLWLDLAIAMTLGSIPWQPYFQRVLSVRTVRQAQVLSVAGAVGALVLAVPPFLIGAIGATADWNMTELGLSPVQTGDSSLILPLVMKYLTPRPVAIIGLGAVSAAVMSSMDSAIMSSASLFTHNIYKMVFRKKASQVELAWALRVSLVVLGSIAAALALLVRSVYGMFILAADIVFVVMLPQLTSVLYVERSNSYGAIVGYFCGVLLRIGAGEAYLSLPALIKYPLYDSESDAQLFPFRTFSAVISFIAIVSVSALTKYLSTIGVLKEKYDILNCFQIERPFQEIHRPDSEVLSSSSSSQLLEDKISSFHSDTEKGMPQNGIRSVSPSSGRYLNTDCTDL